MLFKSTGGKQTLELDGCEVLGLLKFRGETDNTNIIRFSVSDGNVIACARNGLGAQLFIRGNAPEKLNYECTIGASAFTRLKLKNDNTISITCGPRFELSLKAKGEDEADMVFAINNHFSTQVTFDDTWPIPTRPDGEIPTPYSIDLDWGIYGLIGKVVSYSGSNRVRQYTSRILGEPLYVEFGTERTDGRARWFATFNPYTEDDSPVDERKQLTIAEAAE